MARMYDLYKRRPWEHGPTYPKVWVLVDITGAQTMHTQEPDLIDRCRSYGVWQLRDRRVLEDIATHGLDGRQWVGTRWVP